MAFSKITLNGTTLIDLTSDTVASGGDIRQGAVGHLRDGTTAIGTLTPSVAPNLQSKTATPTESQQTITADSGYDGLSDVTVSAISPTYVGSGVTRRTSSDLTASGATVTAPAGYYSASASKSVATATHANPTASINSSTGLVTASHTQTAGYVAAGTTTGTLQLTTQGAANITPSTSQQTAVAAGRYTTGAVTVAAIPNAYTNPTLFLNGAGEIGDNYLLTGIIDPPDPFYSTDGQASVAVPKYMFGDATAADVRAGKTFTSAVGAPLTGTLPDGTAGTPTATKGTVSNNSITVTPSVTNTTGYITGGTKTGTGVTVTASELVSGSQTITQNGTYNVTALASVLVNVAGGGGSGREFESGTWTPAADVANGSIPLTNTHTTPPLFYFVADDESELASNNSNLTAIFVDWSREADGVPISATGLRYGMACWMYKTSTSSSTSTTSLTTPATDSDDSAYTRGRYWATETTLKPYGGATSRYWRAGRTYTWFAVW